MFPKGSSRDVRQGGRVFMGSGLVLLSLQLIAGATEPLRQSEVLPSVIACLGDDTVSCFLRGAVFAWAIHTSIAAILFVAGKERMRDLELFFLS